MVILSVIVSWLLQCLYGHMIGDCFWLCLCGHVIGDCLLVVSVSMCSYDR